jgi:hypothetical protein
MRQDIYLEIREREREREREISWSRQAMHRSTFEQSTLPKYKSEALPLESISLRLTKQIKSGKETKESGKNEVFIIRSGSEIPQALRLERLSCFKIP